MLNLVNDVHVIQLARSSHHTAWHGLLRHRVWLLRRHHLVHVVGNRERLALALHLHVLLELLLLCLDLLVLELLLGKLLIHVHLVKLLLHFHELVRMEAGVLLLVLHHELVEVVVLLLWGHALHGLDAREEGLE